MTDYIRNNRLLMNVDPSTGNRHAKIPTLVDSVSKYFVILQLTPRFSLLTVSIPQTLNEKHR